MKIIVFTALLSCLSFGFEFQLNYHPNVKGRNLEKLEKAERVLRELIARTDWELVMREVGEFTCLAPDSFDNSGVFSKKDIPAYLRQVNVKANIKMYRTIWFNTVAKREGSRISFNRRFMGRSTPEIVNTLFHELLHLAGFSHCGDNKKNSVTIKSVPYQLGDWAQNALIYF